MASTTVIDPVFYEADGQTVTIHQAGPTKQTFSIPVEAVRDLLTFLEARERRLAL